MQEALFSDKTNLDHHGYTIFNKVYSSSEVATFIEIIETADQSGAQFRKSKDVFAIRQFLMQMPDAKSLVFNDRLKSIITSLFGMDYFVVKSIYFDKPEGSNWFVAYHQDLTISVDQKTDIPGFGPWTVKQNQFAVQPPIEFLKNIFTVRIHLDDTDAGNGALKVVPGSHENMIRPETIDHVKIKEDVCEVEKGGIMIMKPLLLHSSSRSNNLKRRRVIHIEFSDLELPDGLKWAERMNVE